MKPLRPYRISVINRITGGTFAEFYSNQVPRKGDQVNIYPSHKDENDPFHLWGLWVVDQVVWAISHPASINAFAIAREAEGDMAAGYCDWVEVHVWPAEGPHWSGRPKFVQVLLPDYDEEEEEPNDAADNNVG